MRKFAPWIIAIILVGFTPLRSVDVINTNSINIKSVEQYLIKNLQTARKNAQIVEQQYINKKFTKFLVERKAKKSDFSKKRIRKIKQEFLNQFNQMAKYLSIPHMTVELLEMSDQQWINLITVYRAGQPFGISNSLFCLGWHESNAGLVLVNIKDPSFGFFHILLITAMNRHPEYPQTDYYKNIVATWLMENLDYNTAEAILELEYWMTYHGKDVYGRYKWTLIWDSWNRGFKGTNDGLYGRKIRVKTKVEMKYVGFIIQLLEFKELI